MTTITNLTCEYRTNPLGIDVTVPRLSWQMQSDRRGARQVAYRLRAASDPQRLQGDEPTCGIAESRVGPVRARALTTGRVCTRGSGSTGTWRCGTRQVRSAGAHPPGSRWAYCAEAIGERIGSVRSSAGARAAPSRPLICARPFTLPGQVRTARLYVTALGLVECSINGQRVGDDVFVPGWTDYRQRVQYMVYDVTLSSKPGHECAGRDPGRWLGGGPYRLGASPAIL